MIANTVHQMPWIERYFPRTHPFFSSPFYKHGYYMEDKLGCSNGILLGNMFCEISNMQATGIPHYVRHGNQLQSLESNLSDLK
jgi:hypothetical protein